MEEEKSARFEGAKKTFFLIFWLCESNRTTIFSSSTIKSPNTEETDEMRELPQKHWIAIMNRKIAFHLSNVCLSALPRLFLDMLEQSALDVSTRTFGRWCRPLSRKKQKETKIIARWDLHKTLFFGILKNETKCATFQCEPRRENEFVRRRECRSGDLEHFVLSSSRVGYEHSPARCPESPRLEWS